MEIKKITARQIFDSRGIPTIQAEIELKNGIKGCANVPSGASTGKHEALELRDGDSKKYKGKSVYNAIKNIEKKIFPLLKSKDVSKQKELDSAMIYLDGTPNKSSLGANAILSVSLACAVTSAKAQGKELYQYLGKGKSLPTPLVNIINGGAHSDNKLDFQEFMISPIGIKKFEEKMQACAEIFQTLKSILKDKKLETSVGDEGGFAPQINSSTEAIELILEAIKKAGYTTKQIQIALDCAASEFYDNGTYNYEGKKLSSSDMIKVYEDLTSRYPIFSIEDPLAEDDWENWKALTAKLGKKVQLVGDDLFTTNLQRLKRGIKEKSANAILIKLNQIGSLSETMEVIELARKNNFNFIISHRSGETEDTFIADLSVATNATQIKTGSMSRSERLAKYNRLLQINEKVKGIW